MGIAKKKNRSSLCFILCSVMHAWSLSSHVFIVRDSKHLLSFFSFFQFGSDEQPTLYLLHIIRRWGGCPFISTFFLGALRVVVCCVLR